jgi:hypothetical protein
MAFEDERRFILADVGLQKYHVQSTAKVHTRIMAVKIDFRVLTRGLVAIVDPFIGRDWLVGRTEPYP